VSAPFFSSSSVRLSKVLCADFHDNGRFAVCATKNGESSQLGTDRAELFFPRLFSLLQGETGETEIIDDVIR